MEIPHWQIEDSYLTAQALIEVALGGRKEIQKIEGYKPTIVGLHGIYGNWTAGGIKDYLQERGQKTYLLDWGIQGGHFKCYLERLRNFITDQKITPTYLLGTSMGGLLSLAYAVDTNWKNINKVIAIATPFDGLSVPRFADIFPGVAEIRENGEINKWLKNVKIPEGKFIHIHGRDDQVIKNAGGSPPAGSIEITTRYKGHAKNQLATPELRGILNELLA